MKWVYIKTAENLIAAEMDKNLLKQEGIPILIKSQGAAAYMGGGACQDILVPEHKAAKAKKILTNILKKP